MNASDFTRVPVLEGWGHHHSVVRLCSKYAFCTYVVNTYQLCGTEEKRQKMKILLSATYPLCSLSNSLFSSTAFGTEANITAVAIAINKNPTPNKRKGNGLGVSSSSIISSSSSSSVTRTINSFGEDWGDLENVSVLEAGEVAGLFASAMYYSWRGGDYKTGYGTTNNINIIQEEGGKVHLDFPIQFCFCSFFFGDQRRRGRAPNKTPQQHKLMPLDTFSFYIRVTQCWVGLLLFTSFLAYIWVFCALSF